MPAYIKTLKEGSNIVYPQTKANAVYDRNDDNLQTVIDDINSGITNINGDIVTIIGNITDITEDIGDINTEIGTIQEDISGLSTRVGQNESDITDIQGDITDIQGDISDIRDDLSDLVSKLSAIEEGIRKVVISHTITLDASDWVDNMQTITVQGVETTSTVLVHPDYSTMLEYREAMAYCADQDTNSLTFACVKKPLEDLVVNLLITNQYQSVI